MNQSSPFGPIGRPPSLNPTIPNYFSTPNPPFNPSAVSNSTRYLETAGVKTRILSFTPPPPLGVVKENENENGEEEEGKEAERGDEQCGGSEEKDA